MADASLGTASVQVKVDLDQLDKGLLSAQQKLDAFDKSFGGTRQLAGLTAASKDAQAALKMLSDQLMAAQRNAGAAGSGYSAATGAMVVATQKLADLDKELSDAEAGLNTTRRQSVTTIQQLSASNDNLASSYNNANDKVKSFGGSVVGAASNVGNSFKNFAESANHLLKVSSYLALIAKVAISASPSLQNLIGKLGDGLAKASALSGVATGAAGAAIAGFGTQLTKTGATVANWGPTFGTAGLALATLGPAATKTGIAIQGISPAIERASASLSPFMKVMGALDIAYMGRSFGAATVAAYALSPALRSVANEETLSGLKSIPAVVGTVSPAIKTLGSTILSGVGFLSRFAIPLAIVSGGFEILSYSAKLANDKLKEYNDLVAGAGSAGVSVEYWKRQVKSADEFDVSVEQITAAMKKFNEVTHAQLGGSDLQQHLDKLTKAGNFPGSTFVEAFKLAPDTEGRWNAMVDILHEAFKTGYGLAALDWSKEFLPPEMQTKLEKNLELFTKIKDKTGEIQAPKGVVESGVDEIVKRHNVDLDALKKSAVGMAGAARDEFDPLVLLGLKINNLWNSVLIKMKQVEIATVESTGEVLKGAASVDQAIGKFGSSLPGGKPLIDTQPVADMKGIDKASQDDWKKTLDSRMSAANKAVMAIPDISKPLGASVEFDKLALAMGKAAAATKAEAEAVGLSVGEHARLNTEARLTEAALQDIAKSGVGSIDQYAPRIKQISTEMGKWKQVAAEAAAANKTDFELMTVLLSPVEKEIATLNFGLHGTNWAAWGDSGVAATIRLTNAIKEAIKFEEDLRAQAVQFQAITAFSSQAKGDIAYQQKYNAEIQKYNGAQLTTVQLLHAVALAEGDRNRVIAEGAKALTEASREHILAATQGVTSAQLDIELVGKSIGQQTELRANLQARQQLEQVIALNRIQYGTAEYVGLMNEYEQIKKINAELGKKKQIAAEAAAWDTANFDRQTAFMSDLDKQIASVQKSIHGTDWSKFMNDGLSSAMRLTDAFKQMSDMTTTFASGFVKDLAHGVSSTDALRNAMTRLMDTLIDMIVKQLVQKAFGSLLGIGGTGGGSGGLLGGLGGLLGGGATAATKLAVPGGATGGAGLLGGVFSSGGTATAASGIGTAAAPTATEMTAAAAAIKTMESGSAAGNYGLVQPTTGALGAYQVMPSNVGPWTQQYTGQALSSQQFLQNPQAQDQVFQGQFGSYANKYGMTGASQAWFAGEKGMQNQGATDVLGTSVGGYGQKFDKLYQDQLKASEVANKGLTDLGDKAPKVTEDLSNGIDGAAKSANSFATTGVAPAEAALATHAVTTEAATAATGANTVATDLSATAAGGNALSTTLMGTATGASAIETTALGAASAASATEVAALGVASATSSAFSGGTSAIPFLAALPALARGGVIDAGRLTPFVSGGIITRPILFPMAGGAGLAGEAGPEAIMPLTRDSSGRLGVRSSGPEAIMPLTRDSSGRLGVHSGVQAKNANEFDSAGLLNHALSQATSATAYAGGARPMGKSGSEAIMLPTVSHFAAGDVINNGVPVKNILGGAMSHFAASGVMGGGITNPAILKLLEAPTHGDTGASSQGSGLGLVGSAQLGIINPQDLIAKLFGINPSGSAAADGVDKGSGNINTVGGAGTSSNRAQDLIARLFGAIPSGSIGDSGGKGASDINVNLGGLETGVDRQVPVSSQGGDGSFADVMQSKVPAFGQASMGSGSGSGLALAASMGAISQKDFVAKVFGSTMSNPITPPALGAAVPQAFATGGIIKIPTLIPMAAGAGLAGEAGPEAIMPLARDSSGRLGVRMGSGGSDSASTSTSTGGPDFAAALQSIRDALLQQRPVQVKNVNAFDSPGFLSHALSSREGEQVLLNFVRQRGGAFKQAIGG
jgi:hypothetical protein